MLVLVRTIICEVPNFATRKAARVVWPLMYVMTSKEGIAIRLDRAER